MFIYLFFIVMSITESPAKGISIDATNSVPLNTFFQYFVTKPLDTDILNFLLNSKNDGKTRSQICDAVEAAWSSVFDALKRLSLQGIIEIDFKKNQKGRPSTVYFLTSIKQGKYR